MDQLYTKDVEIMSKVDGLESKWTVRVQSKADDPEGRKQTILVIADDPFFIELNKSKRTILAHAHKYENGRSWVKADDSFYIDFDV